MAERKRRSAVAGKGEARSDTALDWILPFMEARYTKIALRPKQPPAEEAAAHKEALERQQKALLAQMRGHDGANGAGEKYQSILQPGRGEDVFAEVPADYWQNLFREYRLRQQASRRRLNIELSTPLPGAPGVPGADNWIPIGPSVVRRGQPSGRPAVAGRVTGIALHPATNRAYVATADGGVWRSDNNGASWYSTMDGLDIEPGSFASTSQSCGAIAIDPAAPDRVYVGTGEADTFSLFAARVAQALPTYRGIGPVRSDTGGTPWNVEPTAAGSPSLAGQAFFALAVDPGDRENVVGATTGGLYRREPDGMGGYQWTQKLAGVFTSVVAARTGGATTFFAAAQGGPVFQSADGSAWAAVGAGFPAGASRITLAAQVDNPNVLYALIAQPDNSPLGLFRLDNAGGSWRQVTGLPATIFGTVIAGNPVFQGNYDCALCVDPNNFNTVFMGGSFDGPANDASIYRATITSAGAGAGLTYAMVATYVGTGSHPDVHVLACAPGDSNTVWVGCDGGIYKSTNAAGAANFAAFNTGLSALCANYIAQHPTQPAVIFCGLQDNGTARYTGEECWTGVWQGDGGHCVVNWNDPFRVIVYANGSIVRATDGGQDYPSFTTNITPAGAQWFVMTQPVVEAPINPASPVDAETIAYTAADAQGNEQVYVSTTFGNAWTTLPGAILGLVFAMAFASPTVLYVGTTAGSVYRYTFAGGVWTQTRIDNVAAGALGVVGLITEIAVDLADASGQSIYVTIGGTGDWRHVWHFDGMVWTARSGPAAGAATSLLDVEHNAIAVDPASTATLYAGADIGVWRSTDGGANWAPFELGLPDAAVFDLQVHQASRRLRAALYGRGVYEYKLDAPIPADVELYVRDTTLDLGFGATTDGLPDPSQWPMTTVVHYESPNIKVDVPTPAGYQTPTPQIDFFQFNDLIVDGSQAVATMDPAVGTVTNRVYVEVHNRGIKVAPSVQVMLLVTDASPGLWTHPLPPGYAALVQAGTAISTPTWQTVGIKTLTNLTVGFPQVAEFNLPSTMLAPPASLPGNSHYCLLALLHCADDPYTDAQTDPDTLADQDRKVAQKNLNLVQFVGVPPPPGVGPGSWARLDIGGDIEGQLVDLVLDIERFPGRVGLLLPKDLINPKDLAGHRAAKPEVVEQWIKTARANTIHVLENQRFSRGACIRMLHDLAAVEGQPLLLFESEGRENAVKRLRIGSGIPHAVFVYIEPSKKLEIGASAEFRVALRREGDQFARGGSAYKVQMVPPAKRPRHRDEEREEARKRERTAV